MKKLFLVFFLLVGVLYAQDETFTINHFMSDTLTATIDTTDITFYSDVWDEYTSITITAYTTTGTDTVQVFTKQLGSYAQKTCIDMSDRSDDTTIIVTTTPKEFLIYDFGFKVLRLITADASASVIYEINFKNEL